MTPYQDSMLGQIADLARRFADGDGPDSLEELPQPTAYGQEMVNHPAHYNQHPSGVEVIQITEHMNFCRGNVVKYVLRAGLKDDELTDLRKAAWYLDREIKRLESKRDNR